MKLKFISLFSAALCIISCSVTENDFQEEDNENDMGITGEWNRIHTISGWTGLPVPPELLKDTQHIIFTEDGSFSFFRNDTLVKAGTFTLKNQEDYWILNDQIGKQTQLGSQIVSFRANNLIEITYYACMDCGTDIYERMK